jgi:hypothetical protein
MTKASAGVFEAGVRMRGKPLAPVPLVRHHQSTRRHSRPKTTKALVSLGDWPRVNAATRRAEVALLDDASSSDAGGVAPLDREW